MAVMDQNVETQQILSNLLNIPLCIAEISCRSRRKKRSL
uniref:Uncharacterized protein n=1 Tax=Arundo donax TaxID=35708 RepID=A0A0A9G629_ARUDO